jgi:hypothetical protein
MSSDLSKLIQDTILSTITTNIAHEVTIEKVLSTSKQSFENQNLALCTSEFEFTNLDLQLSLIYPAKISSFIFNSIMQSEDSLVETIDDDIKDSMKEISAQITGALETNFNAQNFEDIKTCKSQVSDLSLHNTDSIEVSENLILLELKIEDNNFQIYLDFNSQSKDFLKEFSDLEKENIISDTNSNNEEDNSQEEQDDTSQTIQESVIQEDNDEDGNEEKLLPDDDTNEEDNDQDKKDKKIKLLIIIVSALLLLVIIVFTTLYFMGTFDEKKIDTSDNNITKMSKRDMILANIKNKEITYESNMINVPKLNKRLEILTKYEILEDDILEKYRINEKERLYKLKMQKLEEFASRNKEEAVFKKEINKLKKDNRFNEDNITILKNEKQMLENEMLTLIEINGLVFKKYKDFINKEKIDTTGISMCNVNNKIKVYIGPLYIDILINTLMKDINKKDGKLITITKKEFDLRCNF